MKDFFVKLANALKKYFYNPKWRCLACGKEIFSGDFCDECLKTLPYNDGVICNHCGRAVIAPENYCSTCKGILTSLDKCRSAFVYKPPISSLIKKMKYENGKYLFNVFAEYLSQVYFKNYFNADYFTYVPMTEKSRRKRGYNQSQKLAEITAELTGVPLLDCIIKVKDTARQAKLGRVDRIKNLADAFRVSDKKSVNEKSIVIIDDVSTTGATAQVVAEKLKKAGAKSVYLLTIASVPPIDNY